MFNIDTTNTYDYMNNFFSGLNSNSSTSGTSSLLGDFYAVQNGSYYKLAKKYYATEEAQSNTDEKTLDLAKSAAQDAVNSLGKLMDDSLFEKVEITDEDGNKTTDYNKSDILEAVKAFAEDYNSVIENTGELDDKSTLKSGVRLVDQTDVYGAALSRVGITIGTDNKLTVDEEAFNKADMTDVKNLFSGSVSFGKNIQTKMYQVYASANDSLKAMDSLYSSNGTKSLSTGNMFDSLF